MQEYNAYTILNPESLNPLILTCEHASSAIPEEYNNLGLSPELLDTHIARDKGCALLTESLAKSSGCTAFMANFSRLFIDYNRRETEDSLILGESDRIVIPGNQNLSPSEKQFRIEKFHRPYYQAIKRKIADLKTHGITPIIFSIHGFTPQLQGGDFRPWNAGILYVKDNPFAKAVLAHLRSYTTLKVDANVPYDLRIYNTGAAAICGEDMGLQNAVIEIRDTEFDDMQSGVRKWTDILRPILS